MPADRYPEGAPTRKLPIPRRVSFAEEATVWGDVSPSMGSPEQGTSVQLVPSVTEEDVIAPVEGLIGSSSTAPAGLSPPPGFSPFSWPVDDGNLDIELSCFPFDVECSPDVLVGHLSVRSSSSPTTPGCSDISDSVGSPEVISLMSTRVDRCSDRSADMGHLVSPLPSVGSPFVPDKLWGSVAPQFPMVDDRRATPVPRWRLAREGPFLEERSPEYMRSFGAGCAFRNTTYRDMDYDVPSWDYGLPMHRPRFPEWIGVPQSACLLEIGGGRWLDNPSRDEAVTAAMHVQ